MSVILETVGLWALLGLSAGCLTGGSMWVWALAASSFKGLLKRQRDWKPEYETDGTAAFASGVAALIPVCVWAGAWIAVARLTVASLP